LLCLAILFCPSAHHLDLHSFPTRRSSDLTRAVREPAAEDTLGQAAAPFAAGTGRRPRSGRSHHHRGSGGTGTDPQRAGALSLRRSEEHTSELQSRENLVCRLLLEKKKDSR